LTLRHVIVVIVILNIIVLFIFVHDRRKALLVLSFMGFG
jgi:uncharacterized membrane protein YsdA (DUF1294 family)